MALNRMHASVAFVLSAAAAISTGCAAREYRVAKVNGMHYIFPPGRKIDRKQPLRNQRVPLAGLAAAGGPQCRMEGAAFTFDGRANPAVTMRLGRVFVSAFNQERMREAVEEFRLALDKLEASGCLQPGGGARALELVAERIPLLALETSYVRYGFNRWRNYIDMRPGMSLGLQYAFARDGKPWGKDLADMDIGERHYAVEPRPHAPGVILAARGGSITAGGPPREWIPDLTRAAMPHYRLFFLTKYVTIKGEPERSATLLGGRTVGEVQEATPKFLENADLTCRGKLTRREPECTSVDKKISFIPGVAVTVNGKVENVTIGTDLDGLLRMKHASGQRFSLERRYAAAYRPVLLPPNDPGALKLPLLDGDRLTVTGP